MTRLRKRLRIAAVAVVVAGVVALGASACAWSSLLWGDRWWTGWLYRWLAPWVYPWVYPWGWESPQGTVERIQLGLIWFGLGTLFLVLAFFVRRGSTVALTLVVGVLGAEILGFVVTFGGATSDALDAQQNVLPLGFVLLIGAVAILLVAPALAVRVVLLVHLKRTMDAVRALRRAGVPLSGMVGAQVGGVGAPDAVASGSPQTVRHPRWTLAGWVGAGVLTVVVILAVLAALLRPPSAAPSPPASVSVASVARDDFFGDEVGDCETDPDQKVPCTSPHTREVFAIVSITNQALPSQADLEQAGQYVCTTGFRNYMQDQSAVMPNEWDSSWPSQQSWDAGHRAITCRVHTNPPIEGSIRTR